jgi:hypothetical protein
MSILHGASLYLLMFWLVGPGGLKKKRYEEDGVLKL